VSLSSPVNSVRRTREQLLARYPDKPWRANFPEVDWEGADMLDAERGLKALRLARTPAVYVALYRGESVPVSALDPAGVAQLGRKP
jgi:hypothetical protein